MKSGKVTDEIFFHTSVTPDGVSFFDANKTFEVKNGVSNPRHKDLINFKQTMRIKGEEMGYLKFLDSVVEQLKNPQVAYNWPQLIETLTNISYRLNNRFYETIFERIRSEKFSELPSRYSCIYLADSKNIEYWHVKALEQLRQKELPIYKFKVTGEIHYADPEWLEVDIVTEKEYEDAAVSYWSGLTHPDTKDDIKEILCCGKIEVIAKYNNLEEFKKDNSK